MVVLSAWLMSLYWVGPKVRSRFSSNRKTLNEIFLPAQYLAEKEPVQMVANHSAIFQCRLLSGEIFGSPQMLTTQISFLPLHHCSANTACLKIPSYLSVLHSKIHLWTMTLKSKEGCEIHLSYWISVTTWLNVEPVLSDCFLFDEVYAFSFSKSQWCRSMTCN